VIHSVHVVHSGRFSDFDDFDRSEITGDLVMVFYVRPVVPVDGVACSVPLIRLFVPGHCSLSRRRRHSLRPISFPVHIPGPGDAYHVSFVPMFGIFYVLHHYVHRCVLRVLRFACSPAPFSL